LFDIAAALLVRGEVAGTGGDLRHITARWQQWVGLLQLLQLTCHNVTAAQCSQWHVRGRLARAIEICGTLPDGNSEWKGSECFESMCCVGAAVFWLVASLKETGRKQ
jgi:hypothetical protein